MPELLNSLIIRSAEELSPRKIEAFGLSTHPANLQSGRYLRWQELASQGFREEALASMQQFLSSEEAICRYDQISADLAELIQWTAYEGGDFRIEDFAQRINFSKIWNEFGKEIKDGIVSKERPYFHLRSNLEDQLFAEAVVGREEQPSLDLIHVLKTVELIKEIYIHGKENLSLDVQTHYRQDVVLATSLIERLGCQHAGKRPTRKSAAANDLLILRGDEQPTSEEKDCRCKEGAAHDPCECQCNEECVEQNPDDCCAQIIPYIGELFVVKDEVSCYEPGEISYIENVMQTEVRERTHRHLQREETYEESEEETQTYEERDQQVDEQFALHKEVEKVVEHDLGVQAGASFTKKASGILVSSNLTVGGSTSYKFARRDAKRVVQDEARSVITRAISRVEKKIRTFSSRKLLNEIEETNRHLFGGTDGAPVDLSRQYYFVNQVRKAQVYSYGYRMMLDFNLPEPSELLKRMLEKGFGMKKPEKPCINIESIDPEEYLDYVQCFGMADLEAPPKSTIILPINISSDENPVVSKNDQQFTHHRDVPYVVPDGYCAVAMNITGYQSTHRDQEFWSKVIFRSSSGNVYLAHDDDQAWWVANDRKENSTLPNLEGNQVINITNWNVTSFAVDLEIVCNIKSEELFVWQIEVYNRLMAQYEQELKAYEEAKAAYEREKLNLFNQNPFILSTMIQEQLKHAAINYISCQFFDENDAMKNKVKGCGFPQMDLHESQKEGEFVRFFEQAFDWQFMSYMLYPYFYARKCSWVDKMKQMSQNGLFTKFLQSGYARVSIPVRDGFESHVSWYLINRQLSPFQVPPIPQNLVPIHQELKESKQNFNADRDGHLIHDTQTTGLSLASNQVVLRGNTDYFTGGSFDQAKADADKNREVFIDCKRYRIIDIHLDASGEVILTLDRDFEEKIDTPYPWSTGALFVGAPWTFTVPTRLVWLREEKRCLPCYPIACSE